MKKNYSKEDLTQLVYNETTVVDSLLMKHCIDNDEQLRKEYESLINMKQKLDELSLSPSKTSIQIILDYSRKTQEVNSSASS